MTGATDAPIMLRPRAADPLKSSAAWALVFAAVSALLVFDGSSWLGSRGLSLAAAVLAAAAALLFAAFAVSERRTRLELDREGLTWRSAGVSRRLRWIEVRSVRIERREYRDRHDSSHNRNSEVFVIEDAVGRAVLRTDAPMAPVAEFERLMVCLPRWWGRPLERVTQRGS